MQEIQTPEHDKFRPYQEDANIIGDFVEWLKEQHIRFMKWGDEIWEEKCKYSEPWLNFGEKNFICINGIKYKWSYFWSKGHEPGEELGKCENCDNEGYEQHSKENWISDGRSIQQLIADYFGIDKKKFDEETELIYRTVAAEANK
jgi:hypothetical protein